MFRLLTAALLLSVASVTAATPPEKRVVLVVWDGMRPDFISAENTPVLHEMVTRGVFFAKHHAAFPSSTEVNGTAMVTGAHPARSGIIANREFRPEIDPLLAFATEDRNIFVRADAALHGSYVAVATIAELVQRSGQRTALAGTKGVLSLHDRGAGRGAETKPPSLNVFTEPGRSVAGDVSATVPFTSLADLEAARGRIPVDRTYPNIGQDEWTTRTLLEHGWREGVPAFSTLWLSDPDYTQHQHGPGSPEGLASIKGSDHNLGRVIASLRERKVFEQTDILVVSDHGFSTIERSLNVAELLRTAGFDARRELKAPLQAGQIMVVGLSGCVSLYVGAHDATVTRAVIAYLQTTDWCGTIFAGIKAEGAFRLSEVKMDSASAPDIVFSLRWNAEKSERGIPGMMLADGTRRRNSGSHASLSRFDQRNTLVAAGPSFQRGLRSEIPSGNIDVAPTILHLLGLKNPDKVDGRVLTEALSAKAAEPPKAVTERKETKRVFPTGTWTQYLQTTVVGDATYFDEGNGEFVPVKK